MFKKIIDFIKDKLFYLSYQDLYMESKVKIRKSLLIKPKDLYKYIGERLIFHNGCGAICAGILDEADVSEKTNVYQFNHERNLNYTHEIFMDWFYFPTDPDDGKENFVNKFETYESVYLLRCMNIIQDQNISVMYVAKPSKEESDFIDKMMTMDIDELKKEHERLSKLVE